MSDPTNLFIMIIFGAIGLGYFIYGKKQQKYVPLLIGIVLGIYPYFVSSSIWMFVIGLVLSVIPYFVRF